MDNELRNGVKTFFLNADHTLQFDDLQLQTFFLEGYEVYPLQQNHLLPVRDQVECLLGLFKELILFFNVDLELTGTTWMEELHKIALSFGSKVRLGVLHHESNPQERRKLEEHYLLEAQIQAGCVYVNRNRRPDTERLQKVLLANEANGRRKAIRMACTGRMNFSLKGQRYEARVLDISVSHFLCVFREGDPQIASSTRVSDIQMMVGGPVLHVDAFVLMKRLSLDNSSEMVYVFGFARKQSKELGLDDEERNVLIRLIHRYCTDQIHALVQTAFQKRWKGNTLGKTSPGK